ncbi:MAG: hypothetical protein IKV54_08075 [Clostridia bacterium]|nr:hypothetical protein [Clostridia bacterium]
MKNTNSGKTVSSVGNADVAVKKNTAGSIVVKVLCVLGAFLIWLYVMSNDSPDYEKTFTSVPVSINGAVELENATGMSVVSGLGHVIEVSVHGIKRDVVNLDNGDILAYVDISEISNAGKYALDVHVEVPDGITVTSVSPDNVTVAVDKTSSIMVSVVPKLTTYNMSLDYILGTLVPEISEISVSGPVTVLGTIDRAEVVVGDLGQLTGTVTASGMIQLVDASGNKISNQFIKIPQDSLKVTVPVYTYKDIPISVTVKNGNYDPTKISVKYAPEIIRVKGDVDTLASLTEYVIVLDEKDLESDKTVIKEVTLPKSVENIDGIEYVAIEIKHESETIYVTDFHVKNAGDFEYDVITKSLGITFRGRREFLDLLSKNNVIVTADLENLTLVSGQTYDVPVSVAAEIGDGKDPLKVSDTYKIQIKVK